MRSTLLVASLVGLLLTAAHAGDKTYRWIDAQGRPHYSDVRSQKSEQVQIKTSRGIAVAPQQTPDANAVRQLECQRRKDQVSMYSSSEEITETDGLGKSRSYTAAERQQLIDRARQQAEEACGQLAAKPAAGTNAPQP